MATFNAPDLVTKPRHMGEFGNCVVLWGSVTPTAGASGDIYRPCVIPAGLEVTDVDIISDDLDSNASPTMAAKVGFVPVDANNGPTANDAYFAASGTILFRAAGRTSLSFQPIKFEYPVILVITLTAASATFASGKVTAVVKGDGLGVA